jgi:catechol 2,3-dioxygenase-like lactoylglutathione lyase family enzyme
MKRMHLHVGVENIDASVAFYNTLFAAEPTVLKSDYAKWMLDDPRINFAISSTDHTSIGVEHIGLQVETSEELAEVHARLKSAGRPVLEEGATNCCYAKSEKNWITDPDGVIWETFLTNGETTAYGDKSVEELAMTKLAELTTAKSANAAEGQCCSPVTPQGECCPPKPELAADAPCCGATV